MAERGSTPGRPFVERLRRLTATLDAGTELPAARSGRVTEFGRAQISGWVLPPAGTTAVPVELRVNGAPVAATQAATVAPPPGPLGARAFRFVLADLWKYVGPADRITVTADGTPLAIVGHGTAFVPAKQGAEPPAALLSALDDGCVFSRTGRLQKSRLLDTAWQRRITTTADAVRALVAEHFGYDVFYAYGSLLGAVREGGFLGHDDDLDLGYLSRHRDGAQVGPELRDVAMMLIDNGWSVEPFGPLLHVYVGTDGRRGQRVDLFPHYFDTGGLLRIPWGMAGISHVHVDRWQGVVHVPFGDGTAPVPTPAEDILAQVYGDSWREPQPGFSWSQDRTEKADEAEMSPDDCDEVYWADFYRRITFDEPSPFCRELLERADCPPMVVDVGCGDGRDSIAFAGADRRVLALDRSPAALRRAADKRTAAALDTSVELDLCDVTDPVSFRARLTAALRDGEPALFYLRFLHAFTPAQDGVVLDTIAAAARPGDMLAAEFRCLDDADRPKAHRSLNRRFRDGDAFARDLHDSYRFDLVSIDHGTGRSPYRKENPYLYRVVARRDDE